MVNPLVSSIAVSLLSNCISEIVKKGIASLSTEHPVTKAISRTVEMFSTIEGLSLHLENWLRQGTTQKEFENFLQGKHEVNVRDLSKNLVEKVGFYYGEESREKAAEIIQHFFTFLFEELLKTEEGLVYHSCRTEVLAKKNFEEHEETQRGIKELDAKLTEIKGLVQSVEKEEEKYREKISEEYTKRIDEAKVLLEAGKIETAKTLYRNILNDLLNEDEKTPKTLFRVYTNLGCCELEAGAESEAVKYYELAYTLLPNDEKAIANMAIAQMLKGKAENGLQYIDRLLTKDPVNIHGLCTKANLLVSLERYDEAINLFKDNDKLLDDAQCCYTLGYVYYRKKDYKNAQVILRKAIEKNPSVPEYVCLLALSIGSPILEKKTLPWLIQDQQIRELEEADSLLSKALEYLRKGENNNKIESALINRSAIRIVLGKFNEAIDDCKDVIVINKNSSIAYRNKGIAEFLTGNYVDAINTLIEAVKKGEPSTDIVPKIVYSYLSKDPPEPSKAIECVKSYFPDEENIQESHLPVKMALIESYIANNEPEKAYNLLRKCPQLFPNNPEVLIAFAKYKNAIGRKLESESHLIEAFEYADAVEKLRVLLILADYYYREKLYDKAIPYYEKIVNPSINNDVLKKYLTCLYHWSNKEQGYKICLGICKKLREKYGVIEFVSEIEAAIQEELGDLKIASDLYLELSQKFPSQYKHQLRYGMVEFRRDNRDNAIKILDEVKNKVKDDAMALMSIAEVFDCVGRKNEAIKLAYDALELSSEDPKMHLAYINLFLSRDDESDKFLNPSTVDTNTVVTLKFDREQKAYMLLDTKKPNINKGEISIESDFGKKLLGLKIGDKVKIGEPPCEEEGEVIEIKSKYVKAFQESMSNFNRLFRDKGLQKVKVGEDLKNIFRIIDRISERTSKISELYKQRKLTIGALSNLLGRNLFDTWAGLIAIPEMTLRCAIGSEEEQKEELEIVNTSKKVSVDLIGLLTLAHIDCLDILQKLFEEIYVSQSALDELIQILMDQNIAKEKGYMTIGKYKGQYIKEEISPEAIQKRISFLNTIKSFVTSHCEVRGLCNPPSQFEENLRDLLGKSSTDILLIAKEKGLPIYSDDKSLREIAFNEYHIKGFNIQSLLRVALNRKIIEEDFYNDKIVKLILSGYSYISISSQTLLFSARKNDFKITEDTNRLFEILESSETSLNSALIVLSDFVKLVWLEPILIEKKLMYLDLSLKALTKKRGIRNTLERFKKIIADRLILLPVQSNYILKNIDLWEKGQVIVVL